MLSDVLLVSPRFAGLEREKGNIITDKTCAACDCKLDENAIQIKIGGKTVDVCCDECAQKLREAHASTRKG